MTFDSRTIMVGIVVVLLMGVLIWYSTKDTPEDRKLVYNGVFVGMAGMTAFFMLKK